MTHTQRMKAMLAGEKIDRPCAALWGPHCNLEDRNAKDLAHYTINFQNKHQFDLIKVMPNGLYFTEDFGQVVRWAEDSQDDSWRNTIKHVINDPTEWNYLKPCDPKKGALAREVEAVKYMADYFKGEVPILPTVFSSLVWAQEMSCGYLNPYPIIAQMQYHPNEVKHGIAVIQETNAALMEEFIKAGADGFFFAQQLAQGHLMTPDMFEEFGRSVDIPLLKSVEGKTWFNMFHFHGEKNLLVDSVLDYPVQAINWDDVLPENPSLADMRAKTDKVLMGGLNRMTDFIGPRDVVKDDIRKKVKEAMRQAGDKLVIAGGCGWGEEPSHRYAVLHEVLDEIAQGK